MLIWPYGDVTIDSMDNCRIAEYEGWTDIHAHDGCCMHGKPPPEEMRFLGWRRKKIAKQGCLDVTYYPGDLNAVKRIERKLFHEGKRDAYLRNLRIICQYTDDEEWNMSCASSIKRCAAILLTLGYEIRKALCFNACPQAPSPVKSPAPPKRPSK